MTLNSKLRVQGRQELGQLVGVSEMIKVLWF